MFSFLQKLDLNYSPSSFIKKTVDQLTKKKPCRWNPALVKAKLGPIWHQIDIAINLGTCVQKVSTNHKKNKKKKTGQRGCVSGVGGLHELCGCTFGAEGRYVGCVSKQKCPLSQLCNHSPWGCTHTFAWAWVKSVHTLKHLSRMLVYVCVCVTSGW